MKMMSCVFALVVMAMPAASYAETVDEIWGEGVVPKTQFSVEDRVRATIEKNMRRAQARINMAEGFIERCNFEDARRQELQAKIILRKTEPFLRVYTDKEKSQFYVEVKALVKGLQMVLKRQKFVCESSE